MSSAALVDPVRDTPLSIDDTIDNKNIRYATFSPGAMVGKSTEA